MWLILFLTALFQPPAQPASGLDYQTFKTKVQPLLAEKRPGHARCITCHSRSTAFRVEPLPKGRSAYTEEETKMVLPGVPLKSRLLTMPLSHEAGGTEFHPGGKHWESQSDPEWKALAQWVNGGK
jgi:hypothetical protein